MSFLDHACRSCPHLRYHHTQGDRIFRRGTNGGGGCSYGWCFCDGDFDPRPILFEQRTFEGGNLTPLFEPGSTINQGTQHRRELCNCEACQTAYLELAS